MSRVAAVLLSPGILLFLFGAAVLTHSGIYEIGELRRMGPGYFPMLLGAGICLFACMIVLQDTRRKRELREGPGTGSPDASTLRLRWRPVGLPLLAILLFATLLDSVGLFPAVVASVAAAGFAERGNSPLAIVAIALVSAVFISVVFVYLLGMPLRLFAV